MVYNSVFSSKIQCFVNAAAIQAVLPGDFDGDGGMDVLLVVRSTDDESESDNLVSFVLWGEHNVKTKKHRLICPDLKPGWIHHLRMTVQPIVVDANGDYVADLFGARPANGSEGEERGIWLFHRGQRDSAPDFVPIKTSDDTPIRKPVHSNAYLDLNSDGDADIFITAKDRYSQTRIKCSRPIFNLPGL